MLEQWFGAAAGNATNLPQAPMAAEDASCAMTAIYLTHAAAAVPVLNAADVSSGVTALTFSPGGDAVAAFLAGVCVVVVWKLAVSWRQKLSHMAASKGPATLLPFCYLPLPVLLPHVSADSFDKDTSVGSPWTLCWSTESHVDLYRAGHCCASLEVLMESGDREQ